MLSHLPAVLPASEPYQNKETIIFNHRRYSYILTSLLPSSCLSRPWVQVWWNNHRRGWTNSDLFRSAMTSLASSFTDPLTRGLDCVLCLSEQPAGHTTQGGMLEGSVKCHVGSSSSQPGIALCTSSTGHGLSPQYSHSGAFHATTPPISPAFLY